MPEKTTGPLSELQAYARMMDSIVNSQRPEGVTGTPLKVKTKHYSRYGKEVAEAVRENSSDARAQLWNKHVRLIRLHTQLLGWWECNCKNHTTDASNLYDKLLDFNKIEIAEYERLKRELRKNNTKEHLKPSGTKFAQTKMNEYIRLLDDFFKGE